MRSYLLGILLRTSLLPLLIVFLISCHQASQKNENLIVISPSKNQTNSPNDPSYQKQNVREDTTILAKILEKGNLLQQMKGWKGKALFIKVNETKMPSQFYYYFYNAIAKDTNNNKIQDSEDEGFFNPASTVKVGISALVLEKLNNLKLGKETEYQIIGNSQWYSIQEDIKKALIISDNEATNRLILFLGFENLNQRMRAKGLNHFSVNRLMLDRGTLIDSPAFKLRVQGKITQQPQQTVSHNSACFEVGKKSGNCSSAKDLAEILIRLIQPELYTSEEGFNLKKEDRLWLQNIMSQTPQKAGFNYEDTFCRFLHPLSQKIANKQGKLLSKCGVSLFTHTFVDTSFLETDEGQKYYIVFAITPPSQVSKTQAINWMNTATEFILNEFKK